MSDSIEDLAYVYDPQPEEEPPFKPGVTSGHIVLWSGKAGAAQTASAVAMADDDGSVVIEMTGAFEECTVVDDTPGAEDPGA